MYNAAHCAEVIHDMSNFGFKGAEGVTFDWAFVKDRRDKYISRLNEIYDRNMKNSKITKIVGTARLTGNENEVQVTGEDGVSTITAGKILIATGGYPVMPPGVGMDHAITSDGFFELEELPKKVVVVGAGYIAVELAGVMQTLGSQVRRKESGKSEARGRGSACWRASRLRTETCWEQLAASCA